MTALLLTVIVAFSVYAIYIAVTTARIASSPSGFADGGLAIPAWAFIFAGAGVLVSGLDLRTHLLLLAGYGLQYNHVVLGLILAALLGAFIHKRLWLASRLIGAATPGELLGRYYGGTVIRLYVLLVALLFALPFSGALLAETGSLLEAVTDGALPAVPVIWGLAFFLALQCIIGGWRGMVYVVAAQSLAVLALLAFYGVYAVAGAHGLAAFAHGIATQPGVAADRLPGVILFDAGLGKSIPAAGLWTTTAILSYAIAIAGLALSPGFTFLCATTRSKAGFAFQQVWMVAAVAAGLLLLVGPVIVATLASPFPPGDAMLIAHVRRLAGLDQMLAAGFLTMIVVSSQIACAFFASSAGAVLTADLIARDVRPDLTPSGRRTAARITLAFLFIGMAALAAFAPALAALAATLVLSLSVQLLPALLGLCWAPWITRSGVITGLVFGCVLVLLTEAAGLAGFESLFIALPWGRWPLTIHSAAWGLFFNLVFCVIASLWTRREAGREARIRLHENLSATGRPQLGGGASRAAKWSLTLIWAFFALGPGAILGNGLFSRTAFGLPAGPSDLPSLFVWQAASWLTGVVLAWWLAYQSRLPVAESPSPLLAPIRQALEPARSRARPLWIETALARLAGGAPPTVPPAKR